MRIGIEIECEVFDPKDGDPPRLVMSNPKWKELDLYVCVHGEKLRWTCDECNEFFARDRQGVTTLGKPWPKNVRTALLGKCPKCGRDTHPNTCSTYCDNCGADLIKLEAWTDQSGREIVGRPDEA